MLSIYDGRVQAAAEVRPGRGRTLRVRVGAAVDGVLGGPADGALGLADLRRYLVADLVRRTGQLHRLAVSLDSDAEDRDLTALNIHPPEQTTLAADGADVCVLDAGTDQAETTEPAESAPRWMVLGPTAAEAADLDHPLAALTERGLDPLALRLAFLEHHYRQPLDLAWDEVAEADAALRDWRHQVAVWALEPSKPMCAQYTAELTAAFDDDLDSPAALRSLRALASDGEIPPGSKFETAAWVDQLLGLDMVSQVGRVG